MRSNSLKATMKTAIFALCILLLAGIANAQEQVNLTAGPATVVLPDGSIVPMWGFTCNNVAGSAATCKALNDHATAPSGSSPWAPVIITIPTGKDLQINLTNKLSFTASDGSVNNIPTSLTIVGQIGGGLGSQATYSPSPKHDNQPTTWTSVGAGGVFQPPSQSDRVQSFATEVKVSDTVSAPVGLVWKGLRPGTYLLESGTHPSIQGPMGLYGMVVVTDSPGGVAYPGVNYSADLPLLLSEIDPVQNAAVQNAVTSAGFNESAVVNGPYLGGPINTILVTDGGSGYDPINPPSVTLSGTGGGAASAVVDGDNTSATYGQVIAINIDNAGSGYTVAPLVTIASPGGSGKTAKAVTALQPQANALAHCGGAGACYPPAVNYTPLYYLFNGQAFDKTNPGLSVFNASNTAATGAPVLVRFVNAGLRMHVPSIVGSQTGATSKPGFSLIAEDGNVLPGLPRVQSEVFLAAGKTYDVMINAPVADGNALPIFDRQLSLSGNSSARDAGMLAYIGINGGSLPNEGAFSTTGTAAKANDDSYAIVPGATITIADPSRGLLGNDVNINGVQLQGAVAGLSINANGTFTYTGAPVTFQYCGNGGNAANLCATVKINDCTQDVNCYHDGTGITVNADNYTSAPSTMGSTFTVKAPGVLVNDVDSLGYQLHVDSIVSSDPGITVTLFKDTDGNADGGFQVVRNANTNSSGTYTFSYKARNSQGVTSNGSATVTVKFNGASGLKVKLVDGTQKNPDGSLQELTGTPDYRWIIEEDKTFYVDPKLILEGGNNIDGGNSIPAFGTAFHSSYMPVVAQGCVGDTSCESGQTVLGVNAVCDVNNGICRDGSRKADVLPGDVALDCSKRYYISVLPGDAGDGGHSMGGTELTCAGGVWNTGNTAQIIVEPNPLQTSKVSVFVFEDDFPLNGENSSGGGIDILAPNEPGLGGFNITLFDDVGQPGDAVGQITYDMFNEPLSNALAGTVDPTTGADACPISGQVTDSVLSGDGSQKGIIGVIPVCPKYESNGTTLSPLAGQAVIANMPPGRYGVVATPGADRIARGEEWLQTNTLDGQKAHDSFLKVNEPGYFQEYGPAGYHVSIGFANPAIINGRHGGVCAGLDPGNSCSNNVTGRITGVHMSRTPDQRLYSSGSRDMLGFTQCYVSLGSPDGADFAFSKCDGDGNFSFTQIPKGDWRISVFDQWNDQIIDGYATPVTVNGDINMGDVAVHQWKANIYTRTFLDLDGDGKSTHDGAGNDKEPGLPFVITNIRYRDGSYSNLNTTDLNGYAGYNEVFPLFNWYVIESDTTRYKNTGTHVVYDAGGPVDSSGIGQNLATTTEANPLPVDLRFPGSIYCLDADCSAESIQQGLYYNPTGGSSGSNSASSTGRIDPPYVETYGWQGFAGQANFLEFGKKRFLEADPARANLLPPKPIYGENGGIRGDVVYASTRPFDDPALLLQPFWSPQVPHVTINLYQQSTAPDGSQSLKLVDTTQTSSWDDWAQGFHLGPDGVTQVPNMNCPGQSTTDPFYYTIKGQQVGGQPLPHDSQFKCYDGMHNWNQLQPAPYDGMYRFPSVNARDAKSGRPTGTNCSICVENPDDGLPMLPSGKYVVEIVVPPGYELVKEEDKNILTGDAYDGPAYQQFAGFGNIFIIPDQAAVGSTYNPKNAQDATTNQGVAPRREGDTGSVEEFWPCVGEKRIVPDYLSIFPKLQLVAPFAGATRSLCDRKEVALEDEMSALVKFYIFTPTHVASHLTGIISDDFTAEFDPFAPAFGEKFSPPNLPVSLKDWAGNEINRVYSDQWGIYNGLTYSSYSVNPPDPSGFGPQVMVTCMNDRGPSQAPDPLYNAGYSQFCYELTFMPGTTFYADTPVVQTTAFADGYNHPDCSYPDATPAVREVDGDGQVGPWVAAATGRSVQSLTRNATGSGYTSVPTVSITGGGGFGAAGHALLRVTGVTVPNNGRGTGYTSVPSVSFTASSGSGATATANMRVESASLTAGGNNYTAVPTLSFPGGTGATFSTTMNVNHIVVSAGGNNYTSAPTVTVSTPTSTANGCSVATRVRATATASISAGHVTSITVVNPGNCYSGRPTVTFSGGGGTGAAAANTTTTGTFMSVSAVSLANAGGSGYTGVSGTYSGGAGSGATATGTLRLNSVAVNAPGSGYFPVPTVAFSGGGGSGATASATTAVDALALDSGGSGYTTTPSVSITGGGGSGATGSAALGPNTVHTLTIYALGDQAVDNNAYSGPAASSAPYNQKTIKRHYGFGGSTGSVKIGGVNALITSWADDQITVQVPTGVAPCAKQQQAQYLGAPAQCGELVITTAAGKQSIDSVTVTIGGKQPYRIPAGQTIQSAIDQALPGDLIIVPAGYYSEMLIMWKPVRLQGIGAASSVINADPHPSGKLDPWRAQISCLFGLAPNGQPFSSDQSNPAGDGCPGANWAEFKGQPVDPANAGSGIPQVDRIPFEGVLGWDTTVNGNLAELLQEPSLMGAYEGAGITVLGKGVETHGVADPFGQAAAGGFPTGTTLLKNVNQTDSTGAFTYSDHCNEVPNPYPSNFECNPSRIDGLMITNSSQGGGGIYVHAWAHNLEISNNRVQNNSGTLTGGMTIGQGEFPDSYILGSDLLDPWTCADSRGLPDGTQVPFCFDTNVNIHNNYVSQNASTGDELFSATPAGAGGVSICTGVDYYRFNYNWVCGNLSNSDGGGVSHMGFAWNGDIEHNTIIFNQSTNPTVPTNGGGLVVMGPAPDGNVLVNGVLTECGNDPNDADCPPGLSDGIGPGLVINANLIQGNAADAGAGGGIRFQAVNGTEVSRFPGSPNNWYSVNVTNNIIVNNVAGWDGAGISLHDSLKVNIVNNTIASNDSLASSGTLFQTFRRDLTSAPPPNSIAGVCDNSNAQGCSASQRQAAGISIAPNSSNLTSSFAGLTINCPTDHPNCKAISNPVLYNNVLWQNRSFHIELGGTPDPLFGQNIVTLVPTLNQTATGQCANGAFYWDLGIRGDVFNVNSGAGHQSGFTLNPLHSVLTSTSAYDASNMSANPSVGHQYCNGSKAPPEVGNALAGYVTPPGTDEGNVYTNHYFGLTPGGTVDESNNWIQVKWGPLALINPVDKVSALGNYALNTNSPAVDAVPPAQATYLLASQIASTDFYGNPRPDEAGTSMDIGAVETPNSHVARASVNPSALSFGDQTLGTATAAKTITLTNTGDAVALNFTLSGLTTPFTRATAAQGGPGTCGASLNSLQSCTINVVFTPSVVGPANGTLTIASNDNSNPNLQVPLTGNGIAVIRSATLSPSSLSFENWATGTTSNSRTVTVTNTGNFALSGGSFTGLSAPFSRPSGSAGGNCGATLAVGASCTYNIVFAPTATGPFTRSLAVSYTGATTTGGPVTVTGTGVATRASVSITPAPLTISLPSLSACGSNVACIAAATSQTGTVTFTNTAPAGTGAAMTVTNVAISGGTLATFFFNAVNGQNTCTGTTLAPGDSCTVGVRFTNVTSARGVNRAGTITFTDNGAGSPQAGSLAGFATP